MSIPYSGIKEVPEGHHRASMKESIHNNQVRYYGLYKIYKKLLYLPRVKRITLKDRDQYIKKLTIVKAKLKKVKEKIANKKVKEDIKKKLREEKNNLVKEGYAVADELKKINAYLGK